MKSRQWQVIFSSLPRTSLVVKHALLSEVDPHSQVSWPSSGTDTHNWDQETHWDEVDIEMLHSTLKFSPDSFPCDLSIICRKPCQEVSAHLPRFKITPTLCRFLNDAKNISGICWPNLLRRQQRGNLQEKPQAQFLMVLHDLPMSNSSSILTIDRPWRSELHAVWFSYLVWGISLTIKNGRNRPCSHEGPCNAQSSCPCFENRAHCESACRCDKKCESHTVRQTIWCKNSFNTRHTKASWL